MNVQTIYGELLAKRDTWLRDMLDEPSYEAACALPLTKMAERYEELFSYGPDHRRMRDFDVMLVNVLDVLSHGDDMYAIQFINKLHGTYAAVDNLLVDLPTEDLDAGIVDAYLGASFVTQQIAAEAFFLNMPQLLSVFERKYRTACRFMLLRHTQMQSSQPAYLQAWANHERLVGFMESILYGVSSRRTRALLGTLTGAAAYGEPTLASTTAI